VRRGRRTLRRDHRALRRRRRTIRHVDRTLGRRGRQDRRIGRADNLAVEQRFDQQIDVLLINDTVAVDVGAIAPGQSRIAEAALHELDVDAVDLSIAVDVPQADALGASRQPATK